jgi:hypothetical protein
MHAAPDLKFTFVVVLHLPRLHAASVTQPIT